MDALLSGHQLWNRFATRGIPSVPSEADAVRGLYKSDIEHRGNVRNTYPAVLLKGKDVGTGI